MISIIFLIYRKHDPPEEDTTCCALCLKRVDTGDSGVNRLCHKGVLSLNRALSEHGVKIVTTIGQYVHHECRLPYIRPSKVISTCHFHQYNWKKFSNKKKSYHQCSNYTLCKGK